MFSLLKRKPATTVTVPYLGKKFTVELDMPIITKTIVNMMDREYDIRLSSVHNKRLSPEKLVADCKTRIAHINAYRDADEATPYNINKATIERTIRLIKMKHEALLKLEPITFVGNGASYHAAEFAWAAALQVAQKADDFYQHQVKALLMVAQEAAESELLAARDHILSLIPDFIFNEQTVVIEIEVNKPKAIPRTAVLTDGRDGRD